MRRRTFLAAALAGLAVPAGVLDSAARLDPVEADGSRARQIDALEQAVHLRACEFPTTPTVDQMPRLIRDYAGHRHLAAEAGEHHRFRVEHSLAQLCAFAGANLADWCDFDGAHEWYAAAFRHAGQGQARDAAAWTAARATLLPVHQGNDRQVVHDAAYAVMLSPPGQLGSTLGNALAAGALARLGDRESALTALDDARRAVDAQEDVDTFTAYSMPWYRLGRFASEVYTNLGMPDRARVFQDSSLPAYPAGAVTDVTCLHLDGAEALIRAGHRPEGAEHAATALLRLAPEKATPILADRAQRVASLLGGCEGEQLRVAVRRVRSQRPQRDGDDEGSSA